MTTRKLEPSEWQAYFDDVAKRIPSMRVAVSILGENLGAQKEAEGSTLILWIAGPAMLLFALILAGLYIRGRRNPRPVETLSEEESARLREILDE